MRKLIACAFILVGAGLLISQDFKIELPPPFHTPSANNRPKVVPRPDTVQLKVPQGFQVEEYAAGFEVPRYMILGPGNEVLLADSATQGGCVYVLTDGGATRRKLIDGLVRPYGLAFWRDYLYVAETASLKRYKYDAKSMTAGPGEEVVSMAEFARGHWTRAVLFDSAGEKMYLAVGSASNVDAGEPPQRAAINRYNPDGSGHEIFASGLRNPTSIHWYPGTQTLWAAVQERDGLGDDLVPDYITHVQQGAFYGWPFAYIGPNEDPRRKGENPALVAKTVVPDLPIQSHTAVLDFRFYTGGQFPGRYKGGAFLALHGSWNRSLRVGYSVVFVPFQNGRPAGPPEDFLTGWMLAPDQQEVWGRPVGLLQLPDGSLLVSEDGNKKLWRVSYKG